MIHGGTWRDATAVVQVFARYVLLCGARLVGGLRRVVLGEWRRPLAWLGVMWAIAWVLTEPGPIDRSWFTLRNVVVAFLFVMLTRWIVRSRKRLVIGSFLDYSGESPRAIPGVSTLLQNELARLYALLAVVDGRRAVPEAVHGPKKLSFDEERTLEEADRDGSESYDAQRDAAIVTNQQLDVPALDVPAPIVAEDFSGVLDAAISIEATMALGPVKVPIGALANLVGKLAQGPRLSGAVHRTGQGLVLTARTVGDRGARTWRVDAANIGGGTAGADARPEDLVEELAMRIFTDIALMGLVRWTATESYVDGLRAYRDCLRTRKDRRINLERAKSHFIDTIARDSTFDLAHYNLGVVTTELKQREAAEAAFLSAIRLNRGRWAPYYGLAQLYFVQRRYNEVLALCGRMIALRQHRAEAYHLRAASNRRNGDLAAAMRDRRRAVFWAWVGLSGSALRGEEVDRRQLAATSLRNLATARAYWAKAQAPPRRVPGRREKRAEQRPLRLRVGYYAACCELRQGRFLHPSDAEMRFELGKLYAARRKWGPAARQLERAVQIVPDRPRFWIQLARAYAGPTGRRGEILKKKAAFASHQACAQPSQIVPGGFERLRSVYDRIGQADQAARIAMVADFERQRRAWRPDLPPSRDLETLLSRLSDGELWEVAQVCVQLARRYVEPGSCCATKADRKRACRVATRLVSELDRLATEHPREIAQNGIYSLIAQILHAAGDGHALEALTYAEAAVVYDPLSPDARKVLARLYLDLGHLEQAKDAWAAALVCDPDGPETNFGMGQCLVRCALDSADPRHRTSLLERATSCLSNAMTLYQLAGPRQDDGRAGEPTQMQKLVRFWLGRAAFERDDYEQAVIHYQVCVTLGFQPLLSRLRLGVAELRLGHVVAGERALEGICEGSVPQEPAADGATVPVGPPGDELTVSDIVTWARIYRSGSRIDRHAAVEREVETIRGIRDEITARPGACPPVDQLAVCYDWEGWGLFQLCDTGAAISCLSESIRLQPTAEAYSHLAQVYAHRTVHDPDGVQRHDDAIRAQRLAALARQLGLSAQQAAPLDDYLRRVDAVSAAPTPAPAGAPPLRSGASRGEAVQGARP